MSTWISCDTPPEKPWCVYLTTCRSNGTGRRVHDNASFHTGAWWSDMGSRIQDVPVSWCKRGIPEPDLITEPNEKARRDEVEKSCAIMRGELNT